MKFPFPAIGTALRERMTVRQRIPNVSEADVERIVRRDFPKERFEAVMEMLGEYGKEGWHREGHRVRVAVLKMANGRLDALRRHLEAAKRDYRDVLVAAEYPEYWRATSGSRKLSKEEHQQVVEADWNQYESWFRR